MHTHTSTTLMNGKYSNEWLIHCALAHAIICIHIHICNNIRWQITCTQNHLYPLSQKLLQYHTNLRQSHSKSSMHLKIGWLISISHSHRLVLLQLCGGPQHNKNTNLLYCSCADAYNKTTFFIFLYCSCAECFKKVNVYVFYLLVSVSIVA